MYILVYIQYCIQYICHLHSNVFMHIIEQEERERKWYMYVCTRVSVSRQTLTLLASLIQEDYVKWKGSLFFRFISTLLDEELRVFGKEEVRKEGGREGGTAFY